ncbi:MAG TPA: methyltransferase [Burkholderiales bacterium]|nr:methyltransferase [Burkholderiales bacterium]
MAEALAEDVLRLRGLVTQYFVSRALYAVAVLDVAGSLARGPTSMEEIAVACGAHAPSLYRILRVLAAAGVFVELDGGRFANTPPSELLRGDAPGSLRDFVLLFGHETSWRSWEGILHAARTGEAPFEHIYGGKFFDYLQGHPKAAAMFDRAMASASTTTNAAVVDAYDFRGLGLVVDVAGGTGSALCSMLDAAPALRGIVFDLPHVAQRAREFIEGRGLGRRCEFVAGSFFETVPGGADAYFMKHILHDWGDTDCARILAVCRTAMADASRLLVCERIVPEGNESSSAKLIDLHMLMTNHGGRERTEAEYRTLLAGAGFDVQRIVPTGTPWSVIEATPR